MTSWEQVTCRSLTAKILRRLFSNEIAAVRVPEFLSVEVCGLAVEGIVTHGFERVSTKIAKIGITQSSHIGGPERQVLYFRSAVEANAIRRKVFAASGDLLDRVIDSVAAIWPGRVGLAVEGETNEQYFAGIIRQVEQASLHLDWAHLDAPGWGIGSISAQLSWNIYLQADSVGGTTVIYRRPWREADEALQIPNDHWPTITVYKPDLVEGCDRSEVRPLRGELVFFNSRNFHEVTPTTGGERITVSSFIGLVEQTDDLLFWS